MENTTNKKTVSISEVLKELLSFNPISSFISVEYTTEGNFYKGINGSLKKADKRDFEILKTEKASFQIGSDYLTRYNNKAKKQAEELKTEVKENWFQHENSFIVKHKKAEKFYLFAFEKKSLSKFYHDENGKKLDKEILSLYAKDKNEDENLLAVNCLDFSKIHSLTFNEKTYILK